MNLMYALYVIMMVVTFVLFASHMAIWLAGGTFFEGVLGLVSGIAFIGLYIYWLINKPSEE